MYESFFGLKEMPFGTQPNPRFAFPSTEHQIAVAKMRYAADQKRGLALLMGLVGTGKCLGRDTPVLRYDGRVVPVQDIRRGDLLMGPDSRPRLVYGTTQGREMLYRVIPTKGAPYVVNRSHILSLRITTGYTGRLKRLGGQTLNVSVEEYLNESEAFREAAKGWRTGVDFPISRRPLRLEPYYLGIWLGDGDSQGPRIATTDVPVVDYLEEFAERAGVTLRRVCVKGDRCPMYDLTTGRAIGAGFANLDRNPVRTALRWYGLLGHKHIPHDFKTASECERLQLLAGLIDSDGSLTRNGYDLVFKQEELAEDTAFLARSLGLAAYATDCVKTCHNNGVSGSYFRVSISGDTVRVPVRIPRKQAAPRRQKKNVLLTGLRVEEIGEGDYYGFEITGDGLFLLGDFTVTHNTTIANQLQRTWGSDTGKALAFLPSASVRTQAQFLRLVSEGFGLPPMRTVQDNKRLIERYLLEQYDAGKHPILLIDEAQNVHPDNIDVLSDLSNFQTAEDKLITIVLLAQDNFPNKLSRKEAFRSRIAVISNLDPLSFEDMNGMIGHRITTAGGKSLSKYFTEKALIEIYNTTQGIPRDVCVLCDAALVNAFVRAEKTVTPEIIAQTLSEMRRGKAWPVKSSQAGRDTVAK